MNASPSRQHHIAVDTNVLGFAQKQLPNKKRHYHNIQTGAVTPNRGTILQNTQ
jgi:hypothetical protein